jgi:hypothetical protein
MRNFIGSMTVLCIAIQRGVGSIEGINIGLFRII